MPGYSYHDPADQPEYGECARCEARIKYDIQECPECGNRPSKKSWRSAMVAFMFGVVLLVIFPPVGAILMFVAGLWALGSKTLKPIDHEF